MIRINRALGNQPRTLILVLALVALLGSCAQTHQGQEVVTATRQLPHVLSPKLPPVSGFVRQGDGTLKATANNDYLFDLDSHTLRMDAIAGLEALLPEIKSYNGSIEIIGYTDGLGKVMQNRHLSQERAEAVRDWLVANEVPSAQIKAAGKGEEGARDDVPDPSRRRVEIVLK